jgi:hypothetical protein
MQSKISSSNEGDVIVGGGSGGGREALDVVGIDPHTVFATAGTVSF